MASIEERCDSRGKTTYRVKVRLKGHPLQTASFDRKTDAKRWASATESAIREGRHFKSTESKRHTLSDLITRYMREVLPGKSIATQKAQGPHLEWWRKKIGDRLLADITPSLLSEHKAILATEPISSPVRRGIPTTNTPAVSRFRGPATIIRYMAALSHPFTIAVKEWGWIEHNPMERVSKPKEPSGRVRYLSKEELNRLLCACKESTNSDLYAATLLALSTGARRMEVMGLRWRQVDLTRHVITLEVTKNGERRALPLAGPALGVMEARAKARRSDTDLVFPSSFNPSKPVDLTEPFRTALAAANITDFRWHDLRHTAASYLAMNGASLAEIAEILGHKTLQMVKRYAHLSTEHVHKVVSRMNSAVFGDHP